MWWDPPHGHVSRSPNQSWSASCRIRPPQQDEGEAYQGWGHRQAIPVQHEIKGGEPMEARYNTTNYGSLV